MDTAPESPQSLPEVIQSIAEVLKLQWGFSIAETDDGSENFGIVSEGGIHHILAQNKVRERLEEHRPEIVSGLCKAALAERSDPAFTAMRFSKEYSHLPEDASRHFTEQVMMLRLCFSIVDMWANRLRHEHWPELTTLESVQTIQSIFALADRREVETLKRPEFIAATAQQIADAKRYRISVPTKLISIYQALGYVPIIRDLARLYVQLPSLTFDRAQDLKVLEQEVKRMASLLKFPISPQLVEEDGRMVWKF